MVALRQEELQASIRPLRKRLSAIARSRLVPLLGLLATLGCGGGSPDQIFRDDVMSPRPLGIQILQAQQSSGLSVESWLHFRGSSQDIQSVLNSDQLTEVPQERISFDFRSLRPPTWWRPQSLGPGLRYYECEDSSAQESQWRKCLFISAASDEAYFLKFYYY